MNNVLNIEGGATSIINPSTGYDLDLGFRGKPEGLDVILCQLGFKHQRDYTVDTLHCSSYEFYQDGKSLCPIKFSYQDGIEDREFWQLIDSAITTKATITARGDPVTFDFQKQMEFARHLRDHYNAVLVDVQLNEKNMVIRN